MTTKYTTKDIDMSITDFTHVEIGRDKCSDSKVTLRLMNHDEQIGKKVMHDPLDVIGVLQVLYPEWSLPMSKVAQ